MSARRISTKNALPPNPTWVEFPRTDGDSSKWPPNQTKIVESDGTVNWMRPVDIDESLCVKWRTEIGPRVAAVLGLPCKCLCGIVRCVLNKKIEYSRTYLCPKGLACGL